MDEINQVGKLISYERNRAEMTVDELCRGLCSRTFLMRVESGERACEKILADALLQRAGVSPDKFVYMINPEEQDWLVLREKLTEAVEEGNLETALFLMKKYETITVKRSKLHRQLVLFMQVILNFKNHGDRSAMLKTLDEAWSITMDGNSMGKMDKGRLTLTELMLVMMHYRILEEQGCREEAAAGYEELLGYLETYADEEDRIKLYPQIAYRLAEIYLSEEKHKKAVELAQKSVELSKVRGRLPYLRQFLEIIRKYGNLTAEEKQETELICESLKWLYETYGVEEKNWIWNIPFGMAEVELCGNLIRARRKVLGMSQESLAENICDPVSISRIECGKTTPKRRIFRKLMERVGMSGGNFETVVQVERPELLELAVQISILLSHSNGADAEPLIEQLEQKMNSSNKFARQYLLEVKALAKFNQNKISAEEHAALQKEALYLTLPRLDMDKLANWSFSRQEVSIINALSYSYDKMGKEEEIIKLLQIVQKHYENKPFALMHYVVGYELTMRNLGNVLGNVGRYEEAIEVADKGISLGLQAGRGAVLGTTIYDRGWDMEQLWKDKKYTKEESLPYVKASYALNLLFGSKRTQVFLREHIEKCYYDVIS